MTVPFVDIVVADNGANAALSLPQQKVQAKIGVCIGGTVNIPIATTDPTTLATELTGGPLVEAGGMVCAAGSVCVAVKCPIVTHGTASAVNTTATGGSTSAVTVTLDGTYGAYDDYYVKVLCVRGCTIGVTGGQVRISLDAGRSYGAILSLGTANTLLILETGITLNFGAGALVAGDYWRFSTVAPAPDQAGITAAIAALRASAYGIVGWGSLHVVGVMAATDVANVQASLDALFALKTFTRALTEARDASPPVVWGGSGESAVAWEDALVANFASTAAKRVCVNAGYYNMISPYPKQMAGKPSYRRPLSWAQAVRRTLIPAQRRSGRVNDGNLTNITVDPAADTRDGFVYFDSANDPTLDAARFATAMTWQKETGFFMCQDRLMSGQGSQFTELVLGNVIDLACDIGYAYGKKFVSDDLLLQDNGTLAGTDVLSIQNGCNNELSIGLVTPSFVSGAYASVSKTNNVRATKNIPLTISINQKGYVDSMSETINLATG